MFVRTPRLSSIPGECSLNIHAPLAIGDIYPDVVLFFIGQQTYSSSHRHRTPWNTLPDVSHQIGLQFRGWIFKSFPFPLVQVFPTSIQTRTKGHGDHKESFKTYIESVHSLPNHDRGCAAFYIWEPPFLHDTSPSSSARRGCTSRGSPYDISVF